MTAQCGCGGAAMTLFRPNVHNELTITGVVYCVAEHPATPGFSGGRAGVVYRNFSTLKFYNLTLIND